MPLPAVAEGAGMVMICMIRSFARYEYISSVGRALLVAVVAVRNLAASYKILPQPSSSYYVASCVY